jgi:hypothetical protein
MDLATIRLMPKRIAPRQNFSNNPLRGQRPFADPRPPSLNLEPIQAMSVFSSCYSTVHPIGLVLSQPTQLNVMGKSVKVENEEDCMGYHCVFPTGVLFPSGPSPCSVLTRI